MQNVEKNIFHIIIYVNLSLSTLWLLKLSLNALEEISTSLIVSLKFEVRVVLPCRNLTNKLNVAAQHHLFVMQSEFVSIRSSVINKP